MSVIAVCHGTLEYLAAEGIGARKYFYPLVSQNQEFDRDLTAATPYALQVSQNILCLPLYAHLATEDIDRICDSILK